MLSDEGLAARAAHRKSLTAAGVPDALAGRLADLAARSPPRPTSCWSPTAPARPVGEVAATYFAAGSLFQLDRIAAAAAAITVTDYFDRLALDRARDLIGDAERQLTAAMVANGSAGARAVEAWVAPRQGEVERIRGAIGEIVASGLTLSKLTVAAGMLGDLIKS